MCFTLGLPSGALAHARLLGVAPADEAVVGVAPKSLRLSFDEAIQVEPGIRAVRDDGRSVLGGQARVVGSRELVIPLHPGLPRGSYTVLWRVLSEDGHPESGVTTFAVGAAEGRPRAVLSVPADHLALPGFERWLFLLGVLLAGGLSTFRVLMPRTAAPPLLLAFAAFALTVAGAAALVGSLSPSTRFGVVVADAGVVATVGAAASVAALAVRRLEWIAWLCGVVLVTMPSAAGHAFDPGQPAWELPVDVLHVVASSVWFGGIVGLLAAARDGGHRDEVLRRFSLLAVIAVAVVGGTGLVRAFDELTAWHQVWQTSYGRLLVTKTALLGALLVLGWVNRYRLIPAGARLRNRLRWTLRAEAPLLAAVIAAAALLTQTAPGRDQATATGIAIRTARLPRDAVIVARDPQRLELAGPAVGARVDGRWLVWETIPYEDTDSPALIEHDVGTRSTRTLARDVSPAYGLAATSRWIVYATGTAPVHLVALDRRSGRSTVLARSLAAPFTSRGTRIAWAEQDGTVTRVIAYDLRTRTRRIVSSLPACVQQRCYRVGAVQLARQGVVFERSAIGTETSFIIRRASSAPGTESVRISGDPQPDLVSSAAGAVYDVLDRGWYRWDFKKPHPEPLHPVGNPLEYTGHQWLLSRTHGCNDTVAVRLASGRTATIASAAPERAIAGVRPSGVCVHLTSLTWTNNRPVTTWLIVPRAPHATGATGVITIGPPPP